MRNLRKTPAAEALDRNLVTRNDLIRLKVIARLHAWALPPDLDWTDLLQEAFARMLDGSRRQPDGVPMVAFLAGVMRSIRSEYWRNARKEAAQIPKLRAELEVLDSQGGELVDPAPDPERSLIAREALSEIERLFEADIQARNVIAGLFEGHSPDEMCRTYNMSKTDYESTRKRIRRILVREGLRSPQP